MKKQIKLKTEKRIRSFLGGSKWADGNFATPEESEECGKLIREFNIKKQLNEKQAYIIETTINREALNLLRYSASEWGNDYYAAVDFLREIGNFIDKHSKEHNYGKHFNFRKI